MIADLSAISMADGTKVAAIDVPMWTDILSYKNHRFKKTVIARRDLWVGAGAVKLIFSNGQSLVTSEDQELCVLGTKQNRYLPVSLINLGMSVVGEVAGMPTVLLLVAKAPLKETRLVSFHMKHPFVANGVVCR